ncbi:MAG: hypothetical protein AAB455_02205 [Patescibacteria group bacterium]
MTKTSIIGVIILVLFLGLIYYVYAPDSWRFWGQTASVLDATNNQDSGSETQAPHETITAKHQFKDGAHIVAGEATSPTPCDILSTSAIVAESFPEQVTIAFTSQTTGEVCAQVITSNRFKVEFQASERATIKATWNGQPVELNLIPTTTNEDLGEFELFIKG